MLYKFNMIFFKCSIYAVVNRRVRCKYRLTIKIVSPKQPRAILLCYNSLDPVSCGARPEHFKIEVEK